MNNKRLTLYVDFDGTLAEWDKSKSLEDVFRPGYSLGLMAHANLVNALEHLYACGVDVHILSCVVHEQAAYDKLRYIKAYCPFIDDKNCHFIPYGQKAKKDYIANSNGFLLDDYTKNLREWYKNRAIKFYNGINGTNGTWKGYSVKHDMSPNIMAKQLLAIMEIESDTSDFIEKSLYRGL